MLCQKCQQKEATVHFHATGGGNEQQEDETVHFCEHCASSTGFNLHEMDEEKLMSMSKVGKKCGFCGKDAVSGHMNKEGGATYYCDDCGMELGKIVSELMASEPSEMMKAVEEKATFLSFLTDPEIQAWGAAMSQKAEQILKARRKLP